MVKQVFKNKPVIAVRSAAGSFCIRADAVPCGSIDTPKVLLHHKNRRCCVLFGFYVVKGKQMDTKHWEVKTHRSDINVCIGSDIEKILDHVFVTVSDPLL